MKKGFTLVEVLVAVAIIALLTTIAVPHILGIRMTANDVMAQTTLRSISKALENYVLLNGQYPPTTTELMTAVPPYLNEDYFAGSRAGFNFTDTLSSSSYTITATPVNMGHTGTTNYVITTGGVLQ